MLKSLFPWKHNKTKQVMAAQQTMDDELILQEHSLSACHVCGRTFLPQPLKKHIKVCEKNAVKKRKPFDSLKQRVEGTDLAQFHQKTYLKKQEPEPVKNSKPSRWKETHMELVTAIRAAKGVPEEKTFTSPSSKSKSTTSLMSSNERCPSCDRQFGPKAFDRHVEWCKERKARIHQSPANVLVAKERLEARIKYKVPPLNKPKKLLVKEKYANGNANSESASITSLASPTVSSSLSRGPSVRKPKSLMGLQNGKEKTKNDHSNGDKILRDRPPEIIGTPSPKAESIRSHTPNYDPFETAQRQFMELLESDEFKPFTPSSPVLNTPRPHTSTLAPLKEPSPKSNKKSTRSADLSKISLSRETFPKIEHNKRASIIDPPNHFKDSMESVSDDFELLENIINDHFNENKNGDGFCLDSIKSNKESIALDLLLKNRKYSDDMSSIDSSLINENDNLRIPEHFNKTDSYSPTSTVDTDSTLQNIDDVDHYSSQCDNKIDSIEPNIEKKPLVKRSVSLVSRSKKDMNLNLKPSIKKVTSNAKVMSKSVSSVNRKSPSPTVEKKKNLHSLKRSMTLFDPNPKPPSLKNKEDVKNYFSGQEQKMERAFAKAESGDWQQEEMLKPEELFAVDDQMYEEYKKYEEMYLREKEDHKSRTRKNKTKNLDLNYGVFTASEEEDLVLQNNNKLSNDSAYGSLTRKTPKHRNRTTKLVPLEQKQTESTSSSGSENGPGSPAPSLPMNLVSSHRTSKFCHECGTRFPVTTAKFCVECGVKRLIL